MFLLCSKDKKAKCRTMKTQKEARMEHKERTRELKKKNAGE
jgi:hypothetical protein